MLLLQGLVVILNVAEFSDMNSNLLQIKFNISKDLYRFLLYANI